MWSGYLATKPQVGLASPWASSDFDVAKLLPAPPLAFCSGWDDPVAVRQVAANWRVRPCLDVEDRIRPDGAWVDDFLRQSGAGLYGNEGVHVGRTAAFHVISAYPIIEQAATWPPAITRPAGPVGWQSEGSHQELGLEVDAGWYDDWFLSPLDSLAPSTAPTEAKPVFLMIYNGQQHVFWVNAKGALMHAFQQPGGEPTPSHWADEMIRPEGSFPAGATITGDVYNNQAHLYVLQSDGNPLHVLQQLAPGPYTWNSEPMV